MPGVKIHPGWPWAIGEEVRQVTDGRRSKPADAGTPAGSPGLPPKHRFMYLLALLLAMLVLTPLLDEVTDFPFLDNVLLTAILIFAVYSFSRSRRLLLALIGLALPAISLSWAGIMSHSRELEILAGVCNAAFIAALTVAILVHVFRGEDVSSDVIAGAIVAYLLMAVMWSQIYFVLETLRPGSFFLEAGAGPPLQTTLRYFSLVTITTVGYGDIVPVTAAARAFANLEAIVGQLYLVIQVAWLVGMHVSKKSK
jgi:voltage-gated potassium channel